MATLHQNFVDLAAKLIGENGRTVSVRRETFVADSAQPWKKSEGAATTQDYSTKAVFLDDDSRNLLLALPGMADQQTVIERDIDRMVLIPVKGLSIDIETSDSLVDGDKVWEITQVSKQQPGPTAIYWKLRVAN